MENSPQKPQSFQNIENAFLLAFDQKIQSFARLHILFALAVGIELVLMLIFIPFFIQSALLSFMIAAFILTVFGFMMLRLYLESQKLMYFESMIGELLQRGKEVCQRLPQREQYIEIAKLCCRLADRLYQREYRYYPLPKQLAFFSPWNEMLSCQLHWKDVLAIRELLLNAAVNEHLEFVRKEPTNPDAHALLANAYVMLSGLYLDDNSDRWIPKGRYSPEMQKKFSLAAQKAVEEFNILKEYAPNDPWIYTQLAYSYRDLKLPQEEKSAYEAILELRPNDHETRFRLGSLYFQHGENARGLKVYEELKKAHYSKADELLTAYGKKGF